jgi:hypothetical protein
LIENAAIASPLEINPERPDVQAIGFNLLLAPAARHCGQANGISFIPSRTRSAKFSFLKNPSESGPVRITAES